ncbi:MULTISPECIES: hypothetical protein [unclassified Streptomyces]|uniref:hypothetical protein n=1 Tax=unclassified Streptomyces TaxID=2593676 RepID=UPI0004C12BBE|nr:MULTISPECIES: hypothetical protein [unclassified Streptomyces]
MTTTPSAAPSLVLRGRDATARFESGSDHVRWEGGGRVVRIPLDAVEDVRGTERAVEVVLTTARSDRPATVYTVHGAGTAAVAAFRAAVRARLPERGPDDPRPEGADLVTTATAAGGHRSRTRLAIYAAIALFAAIDVTAGALGGAGYLVLMPCVQLLVVTGTLIVGLLGRGLYDGLRLPRHGITVLAEFSHYTDKAGIYRYADLDGGTHHYRGTPGEQRLELSYDPNNPGRAVAHQSRYEQTVMAVVTLIGLGMLCAGLWLTLHMFVLAVRG